ncbi:MAG: alpha/beta hydrolase, partial [Betaproteobacteria bacterium]|nr:alpha/beta hydrolase [Betaproteobacteria bacterium]
MRATLIAVCLLLASAPASARAQSPQVVDLPTRPGTTQRILVIKPEKPKAAVVLFAGGDGNIGIQPDGRISRGGNFLVRSRDLFAGLELLTIVIDAPSDHSTVPRETADHVADIKAVIAWSRQQAPVAVWLVGTSRGTQSAAYVATQLPAAEGGPDGVVLTSTVLADRRSRAVPEMALDRIGVPVLVVHHRQDSCRVCNFTDLPLLTDKLKRLANTDTLLFDGGNNTGDSCGARAYHGYNGIE